ncbi:hypothetical protein RP300_02210 [Oligella urethralis]|nr:hypothetical protein RP300_02210 [Oligella urethralis]SUA65241.1 Uncharacterised protein [Oligella urethralis]
MSISMVVWNSVLLEALVLPINDLNYIFNSN